MRTSSLLAALTAASAVSSRQSPGLAARAAEGTPERPRRLHFPALVGAASAGTDGLNHINVSTVVHTDGGEADPTIEANRSLGAALAHDCAVFAWDHPVLGSFTSIQGLWFFIRSKKHCDFYRTAAPRAMKRYESDADRHTAVTNFNRMILEGHDARIRSQPVLLEAMRASTLPFHMYYMKVVNGQPGTSTLDRTVWEFSPWVCMGLEEIRKALKENRPSNFDFLTNVDPLPGETIYDKDFPALAKAFKERHEAAMTEAQEAADAASAVENA